MLLFYTQILTEEDEESPIMSFSNGTILGEISIILPTNSMANVRCATYCEVHSLSLVGLAKVLRLFPERGKTLRSYLREKLRTAHDMIEIKNERGDYNKDNGYYNLVLKDDTIMWLKSRWRQLRNLHVMYFFNASTHCSNNLQLFPSSLNPICNFRVDEWLLTLTFCQKLFLASSEKIA